MKTGILIVLLLVTTRFCLGQGKWCFATAIVSREGADGLRVQHLYVSDVVELSTLRCSDSLDVDAPDKSKELKFEIYERCMIEWFFEKANEFDQNNTEPFSKDDIKVVFRKPDLNCPSGEFSCYFLTKKEARKIRDACVSIGSNNGEQVHEID